jgi:hypothetical protein
MAYKALGEDLKAYTDIVKVRICLCVCVLFKCASVSMAELPLHLFASVCVCCLDVPVFQRLSCLSVVVMELVFRLNWPADLGVFFG